MFNKDGAWVKWSEEEDIHAKAAYMLHSQRSISDQDMEGDVVVSYRHHLGQHQVSSPVMMGARW